MLTLIQLAEDNTVFYWYWFQPKVVSYKHGSSLWHPEMLLYGNKTSHDNDHTVDRLRTLESPCAASLFSLSQFTAEHADPRFASHLENVLALIFLLMGFPAWSFLREGWMFDFRCVLLKCKCSSLCEISLLILSVYRCLPLVHGHVSSACCNIC